MAEGRRSTAFAFKDANDLEFAPLSFDRYSELTDKLTESQLMQLIKDEAIREYKELQTDVSVF